MTSAPLDLMQLSTLVIYRSFYQCRFTCMCLKTQQQESACHCCVSIWSTGDSNANINVPSSSSGIFCKAAVGQVHSWTAQAWFCAGQLHDQIWCQIKESNICSCQDKPCRADSHCCYLSAGLWSVHLLGWLPRLRQPEFHCSLFVPSHAVQV